MPRKTSQPRRQSVESLESRRLLSAAISGNALRISGTDADNVISVAPADDNTVVVSFDGQSTSFVATSFNRIDVRAGAGDDTVSIDLSIKTPARLFGEAGDDQLTGGGGDDTLVGGSGSDLLAGGGSSEAPAGSNTADFSDQTAALSINGQTVSIPGSEEIDQLLGNLQTILAGSGNDQINLFYNSAPGATRFVDAGAGDDEITFQAGPFDPTVQGGAGDDTILIKAPQHTAYYFGDGGDDTLLVARSSSTSRIFSGGAGHDTVDWRGFLNEFWPVNVSLDGLANDGSTTETQIAPDNVQADIEGIIGTPGDDTLVGTSGNESLVGGGGNDSIDGGAGNDLLDGESGNDSLDGGSGNDQIIGGAGVDRIRSDSGDSVIDAPAADLVNGTLDVSGSESNDVITVQAAGKNPQRIQVRINGVLSEFALSEVKSLRVDAGLGNDRITVTTAVEFGASLYGGEGNDSIVGGAGKNENGVGQHNVIDGGAGNDNLVGGRGDDRLLGGPGNDTLNGGGGVDQIDGGAGKNRIIDPAVQASAASVSLRSGVLRITGTESADSIVIRPTRSDVSLIDVVVNGTTRRFTAADVSRFSIDGGAGNDRVEFNSSLSTRSIVYGGDGNDTVIGSAGSDRVYGGAGADWVSAGNGSDILYGEAGDDRLFGGGGRDHVIGGEGKNVLRGEDGKDELIASAGDDAR